MSNKGNNAKSYAEEGLEDIQQYSEEAEGLVAVDGTTNGDDEGELQQIGGVEPVAFFYRTSAPKKATKSPFRVIVKGETIIGRYERSFTGGKFNNTTFLVRLSEGENAGKLIGLPGAGSLTKSMSKLAEGSKVKVTYEGMRPIKNGQWEGTDAHVFTVFGNKLKNS